MTWSDEDEAWFDALRGAAGKKRSAAAMQGRVLRETIRAPEPSAEVAGAPGLEAGVAALERRLESEGLLENDTQAGKGTGAQDPGRRTVANRRWALAAALAMFAIAMPTAWNTWDRSVPPADDPAIVLRGASTVVIASDKPRMDAMRLSRLLQEADAEAEAYETDIGWRVDAQLYLPLSAKVQRLLKPYGIAVPADGQLRIAFVAQSDDATPR